MKRIKIISVIASFIIAMGLSLALNFNEAKADVDDQTCYTWHENIKDCDVPKTKDRKSVV